jgi:hypothetical protein
MTNPTIQNILERRGAWLKGKPPATAVVRNRSALLRLLGDNYASFEQLRDELLVSPLPQDSAVETGSLELRTEILNSLVSNQIVKLGSGGTLPHDAAGMRFLAGGWLEELAWLAALEAGAHEAVFGQVLGWNFSGYTGENEIDVIIRKDETLTFLSCKAFKSQLTMSDKKHRNRLMEAIHEADNLCDHFGRPNEKVAVLLTTDLFDETKGSARYSALMGKAAALRVHILSLEDMSWPKLVSALDKLISPEQQE